MTVAPGEAVIIIQARMGSSRLPGKVMQDIGGEPMLVRVVERARRARCSSMVVVATTTDIGDNILEGFCLARGFPCFRGSVFDVLDRFYQAACFFHAATIVRLTADCPVIDPEVIDETVQKFFESGVDFAANRLPPPWHRTYPIGLDTEVCSFAALERAWREAVEPHEREHVMPYLYDMDGRFRILKVDHEPDYGSLRWTVDTPEDLEFIRRVYASFGNRDNFTWEDVLELIRQHPELTQINARINHRTFNHVDERVNSHSQILRETPSSQDTPEKE